jgi:hypothetical protein
MNSSDPDSIDEPRKKRIEELLYTIGGCEVVIRHNKPGVYGAYPPLATQVEKIKQNYLKKLERLMNGLPEQDES